jgi:hypothetical protein
VAAGLALAAGGLAWWGLRTNRELEEVEGHLVATTAAYQDTLSLIRSRGIRVLQIPVSTNGQAGAVTIFADTMTHRWLVTCHHLAPNQPGQVYQLWFITAGGVESAAVMPMHSDSPVVMALEMPKSGAVVMGAAMSIETGQGSVTPKGPIVFHRLL